MLYTLYIYLQIRKHKDQINDSPMIFLIYISRYTIAER